MYILTKGGKEYSNEGCRYIDSMIRNYSDDPRSFIFSMGAVYNDPYHLRKCLINNRCSYVVISARKGIWILGFEEDHQKKLIQKLCNRDNENKTSWEIALDLFYEVYPDLEKIIPKSDQL